jgi:Rrf2 family protein
MRISARADYAVRAVVELAVASPARVKMDSIATAQGIPPKFLEQIMSDLRRSGLVVSRRGAEGGYTLAHPPSEVTIGDVIRAVEGPLAWVRDERPGAVEYQGSAAPLKDVWIAVRAALRSVLDHVTVADVVDGDLPRIVGELCSQAGARDD